GFCIWIPEQLREEIGEGLAKAYDELPVEQFCLNHRTDVAMAPENINFTSARAHRVGVHSIEEFYVEHTGISHAPKTTEEWLATPQMHLAEAVNGKVFRDDEGVFTSIRNVWDSFYPEDILKKKLAADLAMAGKTGQFNYERCMRRGDIGAAYSCITEFIYKIQAALFLLNGRYMPYYKWRARAMQDFTVCNEAAELVMKLTQMNEEVWRDKLDLAEQISSILIAELKRRNWSESYSDYLLDQAKVVQSTITDEDMKNWNVFVGED
nr:DUF4037 domain-containing protein [Saccharofermentans sp.]